MNTTTQNRIISRRHTFRTGNRFAEALAVQDACNVGGISLLLRQVVEDMNDERMDTKSQYRDPAFCMILNKLNSLAEMDHLPLNAYGDLYSACSLLATNPDADRKSMAWFNH